MIAAPVLQGVRVLDRSTGIAGPYCSKLLADAGADVVKVEADCGDPLRTHGTGALFEFLNASKRGVTDDAELVASAHALICDQPPSRGELRQAGPDLVVLTITPFGRRGPWVGRPWTEFTLQAACGSIGNRGLPERPPLAAGGRIGEWVAGSYAALAALAALREARRSGRGEDVDVAVLDCMAVTMTTYPSVFASFFGWPPLAGTGRSIQLPSIEPSSDGCVVFTANSAQQFQDFLVLIERPDLLEDPELAMVGKRFARRAEFIDAVRAYTRNKTSAELLDTAAAFRIPAAPVLDAPGVLAFEHFEKRDVFVPSPSGRFVQPRVPYRIAGFAPRPFTPAPARGADDGAVEWASTATPVTAPDDAWRLPLEGVKVVDLTAWWAGPSATLALAALGADVVKVESVARPDQMRLAGTRHPPVDGWWEWGPIFHGANLSKRNVTLDLGSSDGLDLLRQLIDTADVLIENFTPRVVDHFGLDFEALRARNPRLIMVRMPAFGLDGPWRDRNGFAQTMEAVSGLAWRTGFEDALPTLVLGVCDPLAGAHTAFATLLALDAREQTGEGMLVESVMVESALNVAAEAIVEYGAGAPAPARLGNRGPDAAPQGVYPGAADDSWVALAIENDAQWDALVTVIGSPAWAGDAALGTAAGRRSHHDLIDEHIWAWTTAHTAEEAVASLSAAGVPAEVVIAARDIQHNPQLRERGLFEIEDHPVTGLHRVPTLPFRFAHVTEWLRSPSPTLGQHNDEVLGALGVDADARADLRARHVIGERLVGT
ncbi:MAG TPA: CoA transferase [Acidimicrobiales bacterium]|jgi:crotonobetainyl-CoA:carnitine CoA-transferase CaiB-like acyl-CoA transferase|nr:CoA transferase [Acidimicrobiales bacterium]